MCLKVLYLTVSFGFVVVQPEKGIEMVTVPQNPDNAGEETTDRDSMDIFLEITPLP